MPEQGAGVEERGTQLLSPPFCKTSEVCSGRQQGQVQQKAPQRLVVTPYKRHLPSTV